MTRKVFALCFVLLCLIPPAKAAEQNTAINKASAQSPNKVAAQTPAFNFSIDGSVPAELDSNINRVSRNATSDFSYSPYLKLSALTNLRPDLTYSIYANTSVNRYLQYFNNNG